jgi:hypothetical protein
MTRFEMCGTCGVPVVVGRELEWGDNGVINQVSDPDHRMLFYESEHIDALFAGIEEIIGVPIERIVIESKAREVKEYVEKMLSPLARKATRLLGTNMMVGRLSKSGRAYGYGDIGLSSRQRAEDGESITMSVRNPHSILFFAGESLGAWEAIQGRDYHVSYERDEDGTYLVTCVPGDHPSELSGRLKSRRYTYGPAGIELERCGECGVPALLGQYRWDIDEGTITNPATGRRMAVFGPSGLEAILDDITSELGDEIPAAVIEAQRRNVREAALGGGLQWTGSRDLEMLAIRGLGNLRSYEGGTERMDVVIENSCLTLMTVGMLQALFEIMTGKETSEYEYSLDEDGTLRVTVASD